MKRRRLKKPFKMALELTKFILFAFVFLGIMFYAFFGAVIQTSERIEVAGYGQIY